MSISIGLLGFGRTGSLVANEILSDSELSLKWVLRKHRCEHRFASEKLGCVNKAGEFFHVDQLNKEFFSSNKVDVVVDFSHAEVSHLYPFFSNLGIPIVSAISKYSKSELEILAKCAKQSAIIHSPNITLGINWLIIASRVLKEIAPTADIEVVEEHFREKPEVSGTAIRIAKHLDIDPKTHVSSIRVGGIVGRHEIIFGLPAQTIRLTHESIDRSAFARGAIIAAKWLLGKKAGMYSMEDVLLKKFLMGCQSFSDEREVL